nr:hypothetical protein [Methylosinus sp. PW1]
MDHGAKALIYLVGPHRDGFELFELAEEIFDQMSPFRYSQIDFARLTAARVL